MYSFKDLIKILLLFFVLSSTGISAQTKSRLSFKVVPLGVKGGLDESNLSAYLIAPEGTNNYICADAGTISYGIKKAISRNVFKVNEETVLKDYIKGYLISHAHLDHIAGLIMNSPADTAKPIYALPSVINVLKDKYFSWQSWANFANEGEKPTLNKYQYVALREDSVIPILNTEMQVRTFALSHSAPYQSTAFLLSNNGNALLYLGDTGPDVIEKSNSLLKLWQHIAPLIKNQKLKAIFVEVSFPNEQPDKQLFGHLTPKWLMFEMDALTKLCGEAALRRVKIVITHRKPPVRNEVKIRKELSAANRLNLNLVYPVQGEVLGF